jgi:hypothetical protein
MLEILQNELQNHFVARKEYEQYRRQKFNVAMRRVRAIIVAAEKQQLINIVSVCDLNYPECEAHARFYIVISGLSVSTLFIQIFINGIIFRKKLLKIKCLFCLHLQLLSETFIFLRIIKKMLP